MSLTDLDVRSSSRHALGVLRYHVWPGGGQQTVADHVGQMLRIYTCVWGPPSPEVTTAIVWHDSGEADAGDCQFSAKRRWPALKAALDECEEAHLRLLLSTDVLPEVREAVSEAIEALSPRERWRLKACDLVDGYEYAMVRVAEGSALHLPVVDAYAGGLVQHCRQPAGGTLEDVEALARYQHTLYWHRMIGLAEHVRRSMSAEEGDGR